MKYEVFLRKSDAIYKVSAFDCRTEEAPRQLALYLFRHYPVSFSDDQLSENGDSEKILRDQRSGLIIWREGDMECKLPEGFFYVNESREEMEPEKRWWETSLPQSKKMVIEIDIKAAYKKGFSEGYVQGIEEGKEEGYRQGIHDLICHVELN
jgi:hypothetical protein